MMPGAQSAEKSVGIREDSHQSATDLGKDSMKQGVTAPNGGMDMKYVEKKDGPFWGFLSPLPPTPYPRSM